MPEYWETGLALESVSALIDFSFNKLGVQRIWPEALLENSAAVGLCKRLGMTQEAENLF